MGFLIVLFVIFLLGWLFSRLAPWFLVRWVNKRGGVAPGSPGTGSSKRYNNREEGDVYISRKSDPEEKVMDRGMGEYVDYEELNENE